MSKEAGLREPEKRVEEEWGPTEEEECGGEPAGLRTGVEWKELVVFSPSWEDSRDGLCT